MTSAYPIADEALVEKVRALAAELGAWPSKRRVMRTAGVGAPRAAAALDALRAEGFDPTPHVGLSVAPDVADTEPERVGEQSADGTWGESEDAVIDTVESLSE